MKEIDGVKIPPKKSGPIPWMPSEQDYKNIEMCASVGIAESSIANILGISQYVLIEAKSKYPRIDESLAKAKDRLHHNLLSQMMDYINDPSIPYAAKRKDIQYILSRKCGWKEQVTLSESAPQYPTRVLFKEVTTLEATDD